MFESKKILVYYVAMVLLFIAMFPIRIEFHNIDYYLVLRIVITGIAIFVIYDLFKRSNYMWIVFVIVALAFNPLIPIRLGRQFWIAIDIVTILLFFSVIRIERKFIADRSSE